MALKFTQQDIVAGLNREEFTLYYQPIVLCEGLSTTIIGAEALIRWMHPKHGLLLPGKFLSVIESNPVLLYRFCSYTTLKACAQCAAWTREFPNLIDLRISINVSLVGFGAIQLASILEKTLSSSGISPTNLTIEITERTKFNGDEILGFLPLFLSLRKIGIKLALDDFGTGYNSLVWLKKFPADEIKLDQEFTRLHLMHEIKIVNWVYKLSKDLGLGVVVEGVEDLRQLIMLREIGYTLFQGYFFYPPMPSEKMTALLRVQNGH